MWCLAKFSRNSRKIARNVQLIISLNFRRITKTKMFAANLIKCGSVYQTVFISNSCFASSSYPKKVMTQSFAGWKLWAPPTQYSIRNIDTECLYQLFVYRNIIQSATMDFTASIHTKANFYTPGVIKCNSDSYQQIFFLGEKLYKHLFLRFASVEQGEQPL